MERVVKEVVVVVVEEFVDGDKASMFMRTTLLAKEVVLSVGI